MKTQDSKKKFKQLSELAVIVEKLKKDGKKVIFANGCFDLIHVGHVRYLKEASLLGDALIVAINSDEMVTRLKGADRPILKEADRMEIISSFEFVDYVIIFNEPTVTELLLALKPAVHAKGTDYTKESVPEKDVVTGYGGEIAITGDSKDRSSSGFIKKIRDNNIKL